MISKKHALTILSLIILAASVAGARSVYVINDTDASEMKAYKVEDANLVYQTDYHFVSEDWGSVGLAVDPESEYLFVTYEYSNLIELINAKTMQYVNFVTASGASDLAGIAFDQTRQKLCKALGITHLQRKSLYKIGDYDIML